MPDDASRHAPDAGQARRGPDAGPRRPVDFELLETLRWSPADGFFLLDRHLRRMERSARHFEYPFRRDAIVSALESAVAGIPRDSRVRLLVGRAGTIRTDVGLLVPSADPVRVAVAHAPIDPTDEFLFHKTTNRVQYERARLPGVEDVVLWNPAGQITETTIANIVVEIGGRRVTPPVECGLLPGTFREELLERGEIVESPVDVADLPLASAVWLINSVRRWRRAAIVGAISDGETA